MSVGDPVSDGFLPSEIPGRLTRAEVRDDVSMLWRLLVVLMVAGLPLGALWTLVTPVQHEVVLPGGASGSPAGEGDHAFDAVAVFVLLIAMFGVVAGAVAWRLRHRRGPVLLGVLVLGTLAGAWAASRVGVWLAPTGTPVSVAVDPAAASGGAVGGSSLAATLVTLPPSPGPWWVVLVAGLAGALTYLVAAIADGREDMRRDEGA